MTEQNRKHDGQFHNRVKLYKVVQERGSNQGYFEKHIEKVLYCGYDRLEAVRIYEANKPEDQEGSPGSTYRKTRLHSKNIRSNHHE